MPHKNKLCVFANSKDTNQSVNLCSLATAFTLCRVPLPIHAVCKYYRIYSDYADVQAGCTRCWSQMFEVPFLLLQIMYNCNVQHQKHIMVTSFTFWGSNSVIFYPPKPYFLMGSNSLRKELALLGANSFL